MLFKIERASHNVGYKKINQTIVLGNLNHSPNKWKINASLQAQHVEEITSFIQSRICCFYLIFDLAKN